MDFKINKVFSGTCEGYNHFFEVATYKAECDKCNKTNLVLTMDGSMDEYHNGQFCLECIKTFFEMETL